MVSSTPVLRTQRGMNARRKGFILTYCFNDGFQKNVETDKYLLPVVQGVVQDDSLVVFWSPATVYFVLFLRDAFFSTCVLFHRLYCYTIMNAA